MILILENPEIKDMINGFLAELEYDYQADRDSPIDVSDEFRQTTNIIACTLLDNLKPDNGLNDYEYSRLLRLILDDCGLTSYGLNESDKDYVDSLGSLFSLIKTRKLEYCEDSTTSGGNTSPLLETLKTYLGDAFIMMLSRINKIAVGPNYETLWIYFKD